LQSLVRWPASNLAFDGVQLPNAPQGFASKRRGMGYLQVVKLPTHMRPTGRFLYPSTLIKMMESGIGIGLQRSAEAAQMFSRMLTPAIR
jgi:hypothetical protein